MKGEEQKKTITSSSIHMFNIRLRIIHLIFKFIQSVENKIASTKIKQHTYEKEYNRECVREREREKRTPANIINCICPPDWKKNYIEQLAKCNKCGFFFKFLFDTNHTFIVTQHCFRYKYNLFHDNGFFLNEIENVVGGFWLGMVFLFFGCFFLE